MSENRESRILKWCDLSELCINFSGSVALSCLLCSCVYFCITYLCICVFVYLCTVSENRKIGVSRASIFQAVGPCHVCWCRPISSICNQRKYTQIKKWCRKYTCTRISARILHMYYFLNRKKINLVWEAEVSLTLRDIRGRWCVPESADNIFTHWFVC